MKATLAALSLAFVLPSLAQEVETDLPQENKRVRNESYFHDETPLNATHSIYSDIFIHKWLDAPLDGMDPIPQAEQDKISDTYIAHWRAQAESATNANARSHAWANCGDGLVYRERWDEALEAYKKAIDGTDQQNLSRAYNGVAEALLGAGKKEESLAAIKEFLGKNLQSGGYYKGGRARHTSYHGVIYHVKHWLEDKGLDGLKMPRYTGNMAFPEAQKAEYTTTFVPCAKIDIAIRNIAPNDARIRLLTKKLKSRGFEYVINKRNGGYPLTIALDTNAPVDKPEGYSLDAQQGSCDILARDPQGVLWGIVSFIQILDPGRKEMRICKLEDWPDCPKRGFFGRAWVNTCEYAIFNKLNCITLKPCYLSLAQYTPFRLYCTTEQCKEFNELGLDFYGGFGNMTMDCAWPVCWNVFLAMQIENARKWASCGLNVYFPYDDARYWESTTYTKEERESGLKPSETDAKRIAKLYRAVKAEYPNFKMQFCPPFYWGPRKGHPYPDSREKYLASIKEHLPEEISVIWTGERVGSHAKSRSDCLWYANLIGRKPSLFQNKTGPHYYLSYIADRTHWEKWYYPGFVDQDMRSIQKNSDTPQECPQISTLADYLWNVKAYDADRSIKRGLDNYAGKGLFEILDAVHPTLCKYDKYKYGAINGRVWFEKLEQVEADYDALKAATEQAQTLVGTNFFNGMGSWTRAVGWVGGVRNYVRKHKDDDPRAKEGTYITNAIADAVKLCGFAKASGDIFLDGFSFAEIPAAYTPCTRRGGAIATSRLIANYPPKAKGVATFELTAVSAKLEGKVAIAAYGGWQKLKVTLNGAVLHEGTVKTGKPDAGYPRHFELKVPENLFKNGSNELVIENGPSGYFEMVYAVVQLR